MSDLIPLDWSALYELQRDALIEDAIELVYRSCCSFEVEPDTAAINATLEAVDLDKITNTTIAISFLGATCQLSPALPAFGPLLAKVRAWFETRTDYSKAQIDRVLHGYDQPPTGRLVFVPRNAQESRR